MRVFSALGCLRRTFGARGADPRLSLRSFATPRPAGKSAIKAILSPAYAKLKGVPAATTEAEAIGLLHSCIPHTFFLRVARGGSVSGAGGPKLLQINPQQVFQADEYYAWFLDANPIRVLLGGVAMVRSKSVV